jgi:F0F1-type ATP synthase membrane subunit c/vacuolar-type H+-ATPase subunit K
MGMNPELSGSFLVLTILGIALTESAAIYGLIIALQIMGLDPATVSAGGVIGAGLAVGAAGF